MYMVTAEKLIELVKTHNILMGNIDEEFVEVILETPSEETVTLTTSWDEWYKYKDMLLVDRLVNVL